jgi:hypothetical protein
MSCIVAYDMIVSPFALLVSSRGELRCERADDPDRCQWLDRPIRRCLAWGRVSDSRTVYPLAMAQGQKARWCIHSQPLSPWLSPLHRADGREVLLVMVIKSPEFRMRY